MDIDVLEMRDHLSRHLVAVRERHAIPGAAFVRPVARLVPTQQPTVLERLVAGSRGPVSGSAPHGHQAGLVAGGPAAR